MTPMLEKMSKAIIAEETRQLTDGRLSNEMSAALVARAALLAIREPDADERVAGRTEIMRCGVSPFEEGGAAVGLAFTAMIDAILGDEKP